MDLFKAYDEAITRHEIVYDDEQRQALTSLESLRSSVENEKNSWRWWPWTSPVQGIYLYGGVGIGKTFLMDLFFNNLNISNKRRVHFHYFMQQVDQQLRTLQGTKNPLQLIAKNIAEHTRVLCFDEFMVDDVAYAMILAELLQALFSHQIILVATSNLKPDDLYAKGVQRQRFLPAIDAIKSHCTVLHLVRNQDYRLCRDRQLTTYFTPLNDDNAALLAAQFKRLAPNATSPGEIIIQNRPIPFIACGEKTIWFDFKTICNLPRSQLDYLELANRFDTVFISNLPVLQDKDTVSAILLIHLVDVFYDRAIKLILSAAIPVELIYTTGELAFEFTRTKSRLQEMQSGDYLSRPHRSDIAL